MADLLPSGASPVPDGGEQEGSFGALLLRMDKRQQQHGEILIEILKLLRPSDDKPGAGDLVRELIARIDRQTAMIRSLLVAITQLGKDLPSSVVAMLNGEETGVDGVDVPQQSRTSRHSNGTPAP